MTTSLAIIHSSCTESTHSLTHALEQGISGGQGNATVISARDAAAQVNQLHHFDGLIFQPGVARFDSKCEFTALMQASGPCREQGLWRDKVAAVLGDPALSQPQQLSCLLELSLFCASHHMIWVADEMTGRSVPVQAASGDDWGLSASTASDASAYLFGQRVAGVTKMWQHA